VRVLQLGDGALLEADVVGLVENEREVLQTGLLVILRVEARQMDLRKPL
jgi:hypothetical protein